MENELLPVALFNGTVVTTNGLYRICDINVVEAKALIKKHDFISAIGHEGTANIMSDLLGVDISLNRIRFEQQVKQYAIVLKLNVRPAEGAILTKEEVIDIGYKLKLMERIE